MFINHTHPVSPLLDTYNPSPADFRVRDALQKAGSPQKLFRIITGDGVVVKYK